MADIYGANVSLLLHGDGTNGSTTFTDSSLFPKTVTAGGSALTTSVKKFGTASIDTSSGYFRIDGSSAFSFGTGDFTIELWLNLAVQATNSKIVSFAPSTTPGIYPEIGCNGSLNLCYFVNGSAVITSTTAPGTGTWYHIALCRSGTSTKLFLDGVQLGSTYTDSNNYVIGTNRPVFGANGSLDSPVGRVSGRYDEVRITKGVARYTSNFTAPTAAFDDPIYVPPVNYTKSGSSLITVTPAAATMHVTWTHTLTGMSSIAVIPYSTKVFVAHSHFLAGNVKIEVLSVATLASHATTNRVITSAVTVSVDPASPKLWRTPNHVKSGLTTVSIVPSSTLVKVQYLGGDAALVIPSLFAYATGWKEEPNTASLVLPSLIGAGVGGGLASGRLPSLLITATGTQELHGSAEAILPGLYFEGTGQREYNGTATLVVPGFNASSYGAATAELILPSFTVTGTGTAEFGGKANCILPGLIIAATGQREYNGTAALVLPGLTGGDIGRAVLVMPGLVFSGTGTVSFANSVGYVMNVHTSESYQWSNMTFNHIIRIGTDFYGVKSTGLYKLSTGYTTDAGTAIDAAIRTKETDFGDFKSKRLQYAYLASDTSTTIQPIVDGVTKQSHASSFGGRKTKMSLGNHGRYWQLQISGIQELTGLELLPQELQRRVK
jgi:hypothetical protein